MVASEDSEMGENVGVDSALQLSEKGEEDDKVHAG